MSVQYIIQARQQSASSHYPHNSTECLGQFTDYAKIMLVYFFSRSKLFTYTDDSRVNITNSTEKYACLSVGRHKKMSPKNGLQKISLIKTIHLFKGTRLKRLSVFKGCEN